MSNASLAVVEQSKGKGTSLSPLSDVMREAGEQPDRRVRRRASREQGQALERLGHAIEYLVDSRLFTSGTWNPRAEQEAVQLLKRASRSVFAECAEVVSVWEEVERLCRRSFARR